MAGGHYCDHGIYVTESTWCPLCGPAKHVIVDAVPEDGRYVLRCSCGHEERSAALHGDMAVNLADALLAMKEHIMGRAERRALG